MSRAAVQAHERAHPRVDLEVEVTLETEHNFYTGLTCDVGEGGLFVATHAPLPAGTHLTVRFTIPSYARPIVAAVEVRWLRESSYSTLPPGMGLRFVEIEPEDLSAVAAFVKQRESIFYDD